MNELDKLIDTLENGDSMEWECIYNLDSRVINDLTDIYLEGDTLDMFVKIDGDLWLLTHVEQENRYIKEYLGETPIVIQVKEGKLGESVTPEFLREFCKNLSALTGLDTEVGNDSQSHPFLERYADKIGQFWDKALSKTKVN